MKTQEIPIASIKVEGRYREDYGDLEELRESIEKFGLLQPITLDEDMRLLAGGRRYYACRLAGLDTIPAILRPVTRDEDRLEIELIENIHRKDLTWQERAHLEAKIYELKGTYRSAAETLGTDHTAVVRRVQLVEAMELIPEIKEQKTQADAWKMLSKVKESIVVGELRKRAETEQEAAVARLIEEGEYEKPEGIPEEKLREVALLKYADQHYVLGDALEGMRQEVPESFSFAEVDPPYGIDLKRLKKGSESKTSTVQHYTEVPLEEYDDFLREAAKGAYRLLHEHSFCIWWFGPSRYDMVLRALRAASFEVNEVPAIWYKGNQGQTQSPDTNLANCYETFFVCRKGRPVLQTPGRSNVFSSPPEPARDKYHATQRPWGLMVQILQTFAAPTQRVLIPFLGSGVTLRACYTLGMTGKGWDKERGVKDRFLLKVQEDKDAGDTRRVEKRLAGE